MCALDARECPTSSSTAPPLQLAPPQVASSALHRHAHARGHVSWRVQRRRRGQSLCARTLWRAASAIRLSSLSYSAKLQRRRLRLVRNLRLAHEPAEMAEEKAAAMDPTLDGLRQVLSRQSGARCTCHPFQARRPGCRPSTRHRSRRMPPSSHLARTLALRSLIPRTRQQRAYMRLNRVRRLGRHRQSSLILLASRQHLGLRLSFSSLLSSR